MSQTASLHIQGRETDPIRVVDLPGRSATIGRAVFCDVRLNEPTIADEVARLRYRSGSWQLVPVGQKTPIWFDGEWLDSPRELPFELPFQVGDYWLTLRPTHETAPTISNWSAPRENWIPAHTTAPNVGTLQIPPPADALGTEMAARHRSEWDSRPTDHDRLADNQREAKRWEARMKAVGERLRTNAVAPAAPRIPTAQPPRTSLRREPVSRRPEATPLKMPKVSRPSREPLPTTSWRDLPTSRPSVPTSPAVPKPEEDEAKVDVRVAEPVVERLSLPAPAIEYRFPETQVLADPTPVEDSVETSGSKLSCRVHCADSPASNPVTEDGPYRGPSETVSEPAPCPESYADSDAFARDVESLSVWVETLDEPEVVEEVGPETPVILPRPAIQAGDSPVSVREAQPSDDEPWLLSPPRECPEIGASLRFPCEGVASHTGMDSAPVAPPREHQPVAPAPGPRGAVRGDGPAESESSNALVTPPFSGQTGARGTVSEGLPEDSSTEELFPRDRRGSVATTDLTVGHQSYSSPEASTSPPPTPSSHGGESEISLRSSNEYVDVDFERSETVENIEKTEPPRTRRLGSATRVLDFPVAAQEPEEWTGNASFVSRSYLGQDEAADSPTPIMHATVTAHESAVQDLQRFASQTSEGPSREWPRVSEILAAQGVRSLTSAREGVAPRMSKRPTPTVVSEPASWSLPLWLGWTPVAATALLIGGAGLFAGWTWARDDYNAGIILARLADPSGKVEPLPEGVAPAGGSWWRTDSANLVGWAAYLDQGHAGNEPEHRDEARALLRRAAEASPLDPSVRHARSVLPAEGEKDVPLIRVLGQSRDILTMAAAGSRLLHEGKKAEALDAYRVALAMASHPDATRAHAPVFLDEPDTARYGLPGEDLLGHVIRAMAGSKAWSYPDWAGALPNGTVARVIAARVLRESGSEFAKAALDAALIETKPETSGTAAEAAVLVAAEGEALALQGSWAEARERYRQAIMLTPVDVVRRAWWLNVAAFSLRLNDESERQKALEAAKNPDPRDEVTQRVVEIQKKMGYVASRSAARDAALREGKTRGPALK